MPQFNRRELDERSRQYGFNRDTFEKVLRLKIILEYFNSQDYLKEHLLLKGGTAINMTIFNLPRLSVDIDLDFVPNLPREETMSAREMVSDIIRRSTFVLQVLCEKKPEAEKVTQTWAPSYITGV